MLTKYAGQVTTLWDTVLPECVRVLPLDLSRLDQLLDDHRVLRVFEQHWGRANLHLGRPSIPMATYLRLMVLKHSQGWGYERLVYQVSDSFHLRLFCGIALDAPVPDESTIRKLTRRFGPQLLDDLIREVIKLGGPKTRLSDTGAALRLHHAAGRHPLPDRLRTGARSTGPVGVHDLTAI